ncbi:MAG: hypothetical protein MUC50_21535 [Myxococcota bacterium]|jgi:hypothetical protein|nr:hypothetical protein [Myxococcota bacterium]
MRQVIVDLGLAGFFCFGAVSCGGNGGAAVGGGETDTGSATASDTETGTGNDSDSDPDPDTGSDSYTDTDMDSDSDSDTNADSDTEGPCPPDMVPVDALCMDRYEAPNQAGATPFVMFHFLEADAWCVARGKRLCFDDEWTEACAGPDGWTYPYGDTHLTGQCNDDKTWISPDQALLNDWPTNACTPDVTDLDTLLAKVRLVSPAAKASADHVESLYQADPSGANALCANSLGAFDTQGNVEEWTRRRDGGEPGFHGKLMGRYWAQEGTCQAGVAAHGDLFRFYETGFRCCMDQ